MFNLIDMTIPGNYANDTAVGAVGSSGVLITLSTGLLIGISTGANVVVAKCIGIGNKSHTEKAVGTSIMLSIVGGFLLMALGMSCAELFLKLINCPESLLEQATTYLRFIFSLCPTLTFLYLIWPIGWILSIITQLIAYFPAISKLSKSIRKNEEKTVQV